MEDISEFDPLYEKRGCVFKTLVCIFLSITYVGSLYVWRNKDARDHPSTIKRRSLSVFCISFLSAYVTYLFADRDYFGYEYSYWSMIGVRKAGLVPALVLPLFLTMILFMGPICLHYDNGVYTKFFDLKSWRYCVTNAIWLRNHIVAPFFEEFTFRACMLPILVPCFGYENCVILCPFFFGIAHLHLLSEKLSQGVQLKVALLQSLFQTIYTTIFGAYSTYLFLRTGHFSAPFVVHAFCNHMGFPNFGQLFSMKTPQRYILISVFVLGLLVWMKLLKPFTDPAMYSNSLYWSLSET